MEYTDFVQRVTLLMGLFKHGLSSLARDAI